MTMTRREWLRSTAACMLPLPKLCFAQTRGSDGAIEIHMTGLRNSSGQVVAGLWSSPEGFPKNLGSFQRRELAAIVGGTATIGLGPVVPGVYAVAVFHDENGNGKPDKTFFGMPVEGVGASNNPHPKFSAPSFAQCSFQHGRQITSLTLEMRYR